MQPESDTGTIAGPEQPAAAARRRRERRGREGRGEQPIDRIRQLVATMKAEQDLSASAAPKAADPGERVKLMGWLRRFLDTRAEERRAWEEQLRVLEARFAAAESAARAALEEATQADAQHQRLVADLKLMHEHQRSVWELERRRLEITIDGLQRERRNRLVARAARLATRPAVAAGLLLVTVAALALSADSLKAASIRLLDRNDAGPAVMVARD